MTHEYKRHGTTTLFAALNVLDGTVVGRCVARHRHQEFIRFLNAIKREVPTGKVIHVFLDNYAARKHPNVLAWFARQSRWSFHFTPAEQEARQDAAVARRLSQSGERRPPGRQPLPAHLPRERVEHEATGSAIAKEALERIAALFEVEARINGHDPERRQASRQERSLPLLAELKTSSTTRSGGSAARARSRSRSATAFHAGRRSAGSPTTAVWR